MHRIVGVTRARREFTEVVNQADVHGEPVYLVNFNEPKAVLIGFEAWETLMQRIEDLEDVISVYRGRDESTRPLADFLAEMEGKETSKQQSVVVT